MIRVLTIGGQLAILWGVYQLGNWLAAWSGLPVPGNVFGVVILFGLLTLGVVRLEMVAATADFLLNHLVFFFVPVAVGLMDWGEVFLDGGLVLLVALGFSAVMPLLAVGAISQLLHRGQD